MNICCTKKLFNYLSKYDIASTRDNLKILNEPLPKNILEDDVWDANLLEYGRKKAVVLCHRKTNFTIILNSVTKANVKHLKDEIRSKLTINLGNSRISPLKYNAYIANQLEEVIFYNVISDKKAVARLTRACEDILYLTYYSRTKNIVTNNLVKNDDITGQAFDYRKPNEMMQEFLNGHDDMEVNLAPDAYMVLSASLENWDAKEIKCRRLLCVHADLTLAQFHEILQVVFGWQNYHLHQFVNEYFENGHRCIQFIVPSRALEEDRYIDDLDQYAAEEAVTVGQFFLLNKTAIYNYDFGDDWQVKISFKRFDYDKHDSVAICKSAAGVAPPEDVGGLSGFEEFLKIMRNPKHPEYEDYVEWYGDTRVHEPDINEINQALAKLPFALR